MRLAATAVPAGWADPDPVRAPAVPAPATAVLPMAAVAVAVSGRVCSAGSAAPWPVTGSTTRFPAVTIPPGESLVYRGLIESQLESNLSSYAEAGSALRKLRRLLLRLNRREEWAAYAASLRQQHGRKRKLLEVLDRLEDGR